MNYFTSMPYNDWRIKDYLMGRTGTGYVSKKDAELNRQLEELVEKSAEMRRLGLDPAKPEDHKKYAERIKEK